MGYNEEADGYSYFPPVTIGGPTGDYTVDAPVTSARWGEYSLMAVSNGTAGVATIAISASGPPKTIKFDGSVTITDNVALQGQVYRVGTDTSIPIMSDYARMPQNAQKRLYVRIDAAASTSAYVTLRFREKNLTIVPGPAPTVHPDHSHQMNLAREATTKQRLTELGIPGYAEE
jgi:hypothetical protein